MNHIEKYYKQNLPKLWSHKGYEKYEYAPWDWRYLPFDDNLLEKNNNINKPIANEINNVSIIEIGSAMGQGYNFLKKSKKIDLNEFEGVEISQIGHDKSCELFPEAKWHNKDFTKYEFKKRFDYGYERHSIHHMPDPINLYHKIFKNINISFATTFRGFIEEGTISDLDKCYEIHEGLGKVYWSFISVSEIVKIALEEEFNHIRIVYLGPHEPINSDKTLKKGAYMAPELIGTKGYSRFSIRFSKLPITENPLIYFLVPGKLGGIKNIFRDPLNFIKIKSFIKNFN